LKKKEVASSSIPTPKEEEKKRKTKVYFSMLGKGEKRKGRGESAFY